MPECGFEILDGEVVAVSPAHEPHGSQHSKLSAILEAHCAPGYNAASDMLTRTGWRDDFAPDGSIYPLARDPVTGGRQLEELAFEVVVTESLSHAGKKAAKLCGRGVRRVFAIDVERGRCLEWSVAVDGWEILGADAAIEDPALVPALPVRDLVSAGTADDAVARALLAKRNAVLEARHAVIREEGRKEGREEGRKEGREAGREEGREEGRREGGTKALQHAIVSVLSARGLAPSEQEQADILAMTDAGVLNRWVAAAASCTSVAELLASR
jgi:Uma2 family endonuclease